MQYLGPIYAAVIARLVLGEAIAMHHVVGLGLILPAFIWSVGVRQQAVNGLLEAWNAAVYRNAANFRILVSSDTVAL